MSYNKDIYDPSFTNDPTIAAIAIALNNEVNSLKDGHCFITNGPYIEMVFKSEQNTFIMGSIVWKNFGKLIIKVLSNEEFGLIDMIVIHKGVINADVEEMYHKITNINTYTYDLSLDILVDRYCYFRFEVITKFVDKNIFAMSNPIWLGAKNINN